MTAADFREECAEELRRGIAEGKAVLTDRLWDRDQMLDSAISPDDPREPLRTEAWLSCGCHFLCDGYRYNRWINPRWVETCKEHQE